MSADLDKNALALVIQPYVRIQQAKGHLSNERRVSRNQTSWICEYESVSGSGSAQIKKFSVSKGTDHLPLDSPISCESEENLELSLKKLANWVFDQRIRMHFEWVWDGSYLWVVQADEDPEIKGNGPLDLFEHEKDIDKGTWHKLDCVKVFRECGLPTVDLWVLQNQKVLSQIQEGNISTPLHKELEKLLEAPIVIRCDQSTDSGESELLLPRTETIHDLDTAIEFLLTTTSQLGFQSQMQPNFCFIIHRFINASASAFSLAKPNRNKVRVDSIWGLPDGLLFYPHDSFELSHKGIGKIRKHIRFKEEFLNVDEKGQWLPKIANKPWDWRSSLTAEELSAIAEGSHKIAHHLDSLVQIMWFIGTEEAEGSQGCLPWYYMLDYAPQSVYEKREKSLKRKTFIIKNADDVKETQRLVAAGHKISLLQLRPSPDLLRSSDFIQSIAELARECDATIELEGSILSHAYYILKREKVSVLCSDPFLPKYKKRYFNKLVRDLIPSKISSGGELVRVAHISGEDLSEVLKAKVLEEAFELYWSDSVEDMKEECVDILEVLDKVLKHIDASDEAMEELAAKKREKRGAFEKGIILRDTQEFPLLQESKSDDGLFDNEIEDKLIKTSNHKRARSPKLRTPKLEGPRIIIPLIPPEPSNRHVSKQLKLKEHGLVLNIKYRDKDICIEIGKSAEAKAKDDQNQLNFFEKKK